MTRERELLQIADPDALLRLADDVAMLAHHLETQALPFSRMAGQCAEVADRWSAAPIKRRSER